MRMATVGTGFYRLHRHRDYFCVCCGKKLEADSISFLVCHTCDCDNRPVRHCNRCGLFFVPTRAEFSHAFCIRECFAHFD